MIVNERKARKMNKTRKIRGRHCQMIPTDKFPSREAAETYARDVLLMPDFEVTNTGTSAKQTWRIYEPLELKSSKKAQKPVKPTPKPVKRKRSARTPAKKSPATRTVVAIRSSETAAIEKLTNEMKDIKDELRSVAELLSALVTGFAGENLVPVTEEEIRLFGTEGEGEEIDEFREPEIPVNLESFMQEIEEEPETEEYEEVEASEGDIELIPEEPEIEETEEVEEPETEQDIILPRLERKILETLRARLNPDKPDSSDITVATIAVEVSKRIPVVSTALDTLEAEDYITRVSVESSDIPTIHLTQKGWNTSLS